MNTEGYRLQLRLLTSALATFLLFLVITITVKIGYFDAFDYVSVLTINGLASKPFTSVVVLYTEFGGEILWIVLAPTLYILGKTSGRRSAVMMAAAIALGSIIELIVGQIYYRPRPYLILSDLNLFSSILSQDPSFPSGHTARAFAGALAFSYNYKRWSYLMLPLAVAVGLSRVYLAVHYPSDIIGGALVGLGSFLTIALIVNRCWITSAQRR